VLTARAGGVNSVCSEAASGPVEELGCRSGGVPFCGKVAGFFGSDIWSEVAGLLPVVPMVEGWLLFCPAASGVDIVLLCWSRTVGSGTAEVEGSPWPR